MKQGSQVTRVDPALRLMGEEIGNELCAATLELGKSFGPAWPSPVFKVLSPTKGKNFTPATLATAIAAAAKHPRLKQRDWNRFRGRVVGSIDALVTPIPTEYMAAHLAVSKSSSEAGTAQIEASAAIAARDVLAMRRHASAIRQHIFNEQQLVAHLDARIVECLSGPVRA